ncbi:bifunctional methylenetetrahydrofolate dehydrogenase/methenyltetrahydrofolate cyclohydrolase FolD [Cuneatibacter caecimuris]|nr:bifunctional methylenetetrahydrofolate dehydrogenase/methenyltetrahydrofolate cyclohydrolase FolD [Cuneatibacter caecimuris]
MKIDGKAIARQIKEECRERAQSLKEKGIQVNLAVIQVGSDPASSVYVRNKKRACEEVGIGSLSYELPEETTEQELLELIRELNERKECSGILVQLPLPDQIDEKTVINAISPEKDVDGFHPVSVGKMLIGEPGFLPCTPAGVIQLLKRSGVAIEGKRCVVVGRSNIVGKPMAVLLLRENGTVTVAHSRTKDLKAVCREADILVAAVGKPRMITEEYIKPGAAVIDVGIHRDENNRLCGDVDTVRARRAAGAVTPVPGGVGPMTIAMLMDNCIRSAEKLFTGIS